MIFMIYLVALSLSSGRLIYTTAGSNTVFAAVVAIIYGLIVALTTGMSVAIFAKTADRDVGMKRTHLAQFFVVWMLAWGVVVMFGAGYVGDWLRQYTSPEINGPTGGSSPRTTD